MQHHRFFPEPDIYAVHRESWMDSSEYRELKKLEKAVNTFYTDEVKVTKQQFQEAAAGTTTKQDEPDEVNLSSSSSSLSSPHDTKIAGDKNFETNQQKIVLRNESLLKKLLQEKKEDLQRLLTMTLNSFVQKYENCVTLKDQKSIRLVLDRIDAGLAVLKAAENLMGEPLNACLISGNNGSCKKLELNHFLHPGKKKLLKMKKKKEAGVVSPDSAADHVGVDIDDTPDRRGGQHQVHGGPQQTGQHKPTPAPYLNQQHLYKKLQSLEQDILHTDPAEKDTEPALEMKILAQFLQDLSSTNAHETILNNPNQLELYRALEQCAQTGGGVLTSTCDSLKPFHLCSLHNGFINNNNEVGTKNYGKKPVEQQEETTAKNAGKRTSTTSLVHHLTFPAILDHIFETNLILLKRATVLKKLQNLLQSDRLGAHLAENTKLFQELKFLRLDTWNNEAFNEAKQRIDKYKSSVWFGQNLTQMLDGTFFGDNNGARAGAAGTAAAPNRGGTATAGSVMVNNFTSDNAGPSSTDATTAGANNNNRTFTLSSLWKPKVQSLSLHRLIQDLIDDTFIKDVKTRDRKDSVHGNKVPKRLLVQKITKIQNSKHFSLYQERKREILEDCKKLEKLNGQQNVHAVKKYCVKSKEDNIKTFSAIPSWTQKCPNLFKQEPIEPQNVNEFYLFHGTTPEAAELITDTEFHLKKAGTNAGSLYGKGLYFAESSTKADEYTTETRDEELRPLILCRVVLGHVRYCEKQKLEKAEVEALVRQCTKSENTDQVLDPAAPSSLYHSVLGDREKCRNTFREFVVYDQAQTYPEYIVWYKRKY
ncbi:unnamed protein product [Amoebophrya sp. A120]|nr:unnamed protein product [Amoebophrya sp. A120]|eukprot:GSA120T00007148001.1